MQEKACETLLGWGANPDQPDNDGVTPKKIARFNPHILASIHKQQVSCQDYCCLYAHAKFCTHPTIICATSLQS